MYGKSPYPTLREVCGLRKNISDSESACRGYKKRHRDSEDLHRGYVDGVSL